MIACILTIVIFIKAPTVRNFWPNITLRLISSYAINMTNSSTGSRRFALFSSSIHSTFRSYLFYTPIVAAAWQRIGYEVIVILVGDWTNITSSVLQAQLNLTETFLQQLNVHVIHLQCNRSYAVKIAQLVRIFGGYLSERIVHDDDYILTTDSDLIPIHGEDYELEGNYSGVVHNALCCGFFQRRGETYPMYSMSHICLRKRVWRDLFLQSIQRDELLNTSANATLLSVNASLSFETISLYTRHEFPDSYDSNMTKNDAAWFMDQIYVSMLLDDYSKKNPNIRISKQRWRSFRLDPHFPDSEWRPGKIKEYGDAHLIHDEIFQVHRWKLMHNLLDLLFQPSLVNQFDHFYEKFKLTLSVKSDEY